MHFGFFGIDNFGRPTSSSRACSTPFQFVMGEDSEAVPKRTPFAAKRREESDDVQKSKKEKKEKKSKRDREGGGGGDSEKEVGVIRATCRASYVPFHAHPPARRIHSRLT